MADSTAMGIESFRAQEKSTISTASVLVILRVSRYVERRPAQGIGHQPVGQPGGVVLGGGFELLRVLDHPDDPVIPPAADGLFDA